MPEIRFLRLAEVKKRTGLSKTTIYREIDRQKFPQRVRLSQNSVAWLESEIIDWMNQRLSSRDNGQTV